MLKCRLYVSLVVELRPLLRASRNSMHKAHERVGGRPRALDTFHTNTAVWPVRRGCVAVG